MSCHKRIESLVDFILKSRDEGDLLAFCGAGISILPPSRLPVAAELMEEVTNFFTKPYRHYIKEFHLRPEVLFGIIIKYEEQNLLALLHSILSVGSFNAQHSFIASLLGAGCNVITTNFDTLIEQACIANKINYHRVISRLPSFMHKPAIYKIHGSIDSHKSMMYTINHINKGLSKKKIDFLKDLTIDKTVIVFGYSGNDQLDIMPALSKCEYRKLVWIAHDNEILQPLQCIPDNKYIASMHNLEYIKLNTNKLIERLSAFEKSSGSAIKKTYKYSPISNDTYAKITLSILMHHNSFEEVERLIEDEKLKGDLYFDALKYSARRPQGYMSENDDLERRLIIDRIEILPAIERKPFYPFIARYARTKGEVDRIADLIIDGLENNDNSPEIYEAAIEVAFELYQYREFESSNQLLARVLSLAKRTGDLLLEARSNIVISGMMIFKYNYTEGRKSHLLQAIKHADRAIYLLEEDIFNDRFYLAQAKNNKAIALKYIGNFSEALSLYKQVLMYFINTNESLYVQAMSNMANLYLDLNDAKNCLKYLNTAQKILKGARSFMVARLYRQKAKALLLRSRNIRSTKAIEKLLHLSTEIFFETGHLAEIQENSDLLNHLK